MRRDDASEECERDARECEEASRRGRYFCTICGENEVDVWNGYDTCDECLSKQ